MVDHISVLGCKILTIGDLSLAFASLFALNSSSSNDTLFCPIVLVQCFMAAILDRARSGWQTVALLVIGVTASQSCRTARVVGVAAVSVIADFTLGGTIIFINAVRMLLGNDLVAIVFMTVFRMGVVMIMSVVVAIVNPIMIVMVTTMGLNLAVIASCIIVVVRFSRRATAGRAVLLRVGRTAVGTHRSEDGWMGWRGLCFSGLLE